jgi:RimJ/RimL family protein N-acetyltransferase
MKLLRKLGRKLNAIAGVGIEETHFFEMAIDSPTFNSPLPQGVRIRVLGSEELLDFCNVSAMDRQFIEDRWAAKDRCYLAYFEGKLAHYSWVKSAGVQEITEADLQIPVAQGEFWIYHCWTAEWARGRRIYPCMLTLIARDYYQLGFTRANIYTSRANLPSQRGIKYAGFQYTFSKWSLRLGSHWYRLKR